MKKIFSYCAITLLFALTTSNIAQASFVECVRAGLKWGFCWKNRNWDGNSELARSQRPVVTLGAKQDLLLLPNSDLILIRDNAEFLGTLDLDAKAYLNKKLAEPLSVPNSDGVIGKGDYSHSPGKSAYKVKNN